MNSNLDLAMPQFISVGVVAKNCGVSNTTVLRWINNGEIPAFRLPGGHYRIDSRDFLDFMNRYHIPAVDRIPGTGTRM